MHSTSRLLLVLVLFIPDVYCVQLQPPHAFSAEDMKNFADIVSDFVKVHKKYVTDLKQHELGPHIIEMAKDAGGRHKGQTQQSLDEDYDNDISQFQQDSTQNIRMGVGATGLSHLLSERMDPGSKIVLNKREHQEAMQTVEKLSSPSQDASRKEQMKQQRFEADVSSDSGMSFLEVNTQKNWWQNPRPTGSTKVTYGESNNWWRCSCGNPRWSCQNVMNCLQPEITENDRMKEKAELDKIAAVTGVMPESRYAGLKFHPKSLDCTVNLGYDCTWSRDCDCMLPWMNVKECRPLKKVAPKRCPVKCDKKAWPWNWICSRSCWCPDCSSPYCAHYFWFTLVCRKYCVCEAKCPESPISLE